MTANDSGRVAPGLRAMVGMAALVIVIAGMRAAQVVLAQVLLAAFLAVICFPALAWLQRKRVPNALSLLIVIGGGVVLVLLLVGLIGISLSDFTNQEKLDFYRQRLDGQKEQLLAWMEGHGLHIEERVEEQAGFDPKKLINLVHIILAALTSLFSNVVLILLIFAFILGEASILPDKLRAMPGHTKARDERIQSILENIRHYLAIKTQVSLLTGVLVTVWLLILGVDYAMLWGLVAFFMNYVPNVGSVIAAIPAVVLALVQKDLATAVYTAAGYVAINMVCGNVLEPRWLGRGLGLSPLVVFLSLIFWGWVLGPVGMLLSVPLTMIVKIVLDSLEETRWIAILLGPAPEPDAVTPTSEPDDSSPAGATAD